MTVSRAIKSSPVLLEILASLRAVEALAADAPAVSTCDSFCAWSELPPDFMAGGDTAAAETCPGSFSGPTALNKSTSVDAAAAFSAGTAPELCAEDLPVRRIPN